MKNFIETSRTAKRRSEFQKRLLTPLPNPEWMVKNEFSEIAWGDCSDSPEFQLLWNLSFYDKEGRLMRLEQWHLNEFGFEIWYEGVYSYSENRATLTWISIDSDVVGEEAIELDSNGRIPNPDAYKDELPFPNRPIEPTYEVNPEWKKTERIEEGIDLISSSVNRKWVYVEYTDKQGETRREERYIIDENGKKTMVYESVIVNRDGEDWLWFNNGGLIQEEIKLKDYLGEIE